MVKFGKEYRKYQIKQWKDSYINYKLLKQEIRSIRVNIDKQKAIERGTDASAVELGHPSLKPLELVPDESIVIQEGQDLQSLYNIKYGGELKKFIDLLEQEFRKSYIHFVSQEKELYKKVNGHCYSSRSYNEYNIINIFKEIKDIYATLRLAKKLNCFINDNIMAMKKILKKFDKKYQKYFGIIGPKYILTHLTSQNSDLEYVLQFKLIDESTAVCEYNLKTLLERAKYLIKNNADILPINEENINMNEIDNRIKNLKKKIEEELDTIDELTYFKIQYREWFYYAKQNERIVKNNPAIYDNDIYNPVLSATYLKDSILEKCISNPDAINEIKKSQSPLSYSNSFNLILLYIYTCFYGSMLSNIFPLIPNYFVTYLIKENNFKALFLVPLIATYIGYLIPYTIFIKINYRDKNNTFMSVSYILSYLFILMSSSLLILMNNSTEDKTLKIFGIILSRFLLGFSNNKMMTKKYITLYLPKFVLSSVSKKFIISELIGEIVGPLISLVLSNISENEMGKVSYTKFNCIGWYGIAISILMGIIHLIFFTKPLSSNFLMVKDEKNITGNKFYQKSEKDMIRKNYQKEQNLIYKKQYHSLKKKKKKEKNEEEEGKDEIEKLIISKSSNSDAKEENNDKEDDLKEQLIDDASNKDISSRTKSYEMEGNSLEVSYGGNLALTTKQQNMINTIEKELEKRNELSNFDDMNQIAKKIKDIINKERNELGYINQNILLILIIYFISSLSQMHLILNYIYYIQENIYANDINLNMFCILIFLLFLPQIFKIFFVFQFYQVNYKFKIFLFGSVVNLLLVNIPLIFEEVYNMDYAFIILNILLVLGCNIINLSCSCYLSFIMSPDWQFCCLGVGPSINYSIILGKIFGGIISLIFSNYEQINHWVWMGITIVFFIYIFILIFFTRIIRIKGISRIIRKNACEANKEN